MMRWRQELTYILRRLRRRWAEQELEEEIQGHLELEIKENIEAGMSPEEARFAALRAFGSVSVAKEESRAIWGLRWLETFWQDLRYAFRVLRKSPGFSVAVVVILTLGMGASTSLFSLIDGCLIHNIPYSVLDRWVAIRARLPQQNAFSNFFSVPELVEMKELRDVFDDVGALHGVNFALTSGDYPERVQGTWVTANAITMTGIRPLLGRTFREDEDRPGGPSVVVLSYELWQQRYSGDPNILGKTLTLNGVTYTVIGVMPPHFGLWGGELWVPFQLNMADPDRGNRRFWVVALIKPGVSEALADARLRAFSKQLEQRFGRTNPEYAGMQLSVWNIEEAVIGGIKPSLLVLLGAVALLLLISCANVANLLLARATGRHREMAVRTALGASRFRLARQTLTESLLLSTAGGVAGVLLSLWLLPLLVHLIPRVWLTGDAELIRVNYRVIIAVTGLSLLTGGIFGMAPAMQATRATISEALKEGSQKIGGDRRGRRARGALVVSEITLAVVVLAGAALMIRSYRQLEGVDLGFKADHLLSFEVSLPPTKYSNGQRIAAFYQEMIRRIDALPGVEGAAVVSGLPLGYRAVDVSMRDFVIEGRPVEDARGSANANYRLVSSNYFNVLGIRLLRGRSFTDGDNAESPPVAIINETMARLYWPDSDPVGQRIRLGTRYGRRFEDTGETNDASPFTIVGIVADSKQTRVIDAPVRQEFYIHQLQWAGERRTMAALVRGTSDTAQLTSAVRRAVSSIDPEQPIAAVGTMDQIVADSFGPKRLTMLLLGFLAAAALVLAVVGLYAILAYSVSHRTHEIGIRMALGAQPLDVLKLVVKQGMVMALTGVAIGLVAAFALTRVMSSLLYGVSATDPATFTLVALLLIAVALLASYLPARRATKVDPMIALRYE